MIEGIDLEKKQHLNNEKEELSFGKDFYRLRSHYRTTYLAKVIDDYILSQSTVKRDGTLREPSNKDIVQKLREANYKMDPSHFSRIRTGQTTIKNLSKIAHLARALHVDFKILAGALYLDGIIEKKTIEHFGIEDSILDMLQNKDHINSQNIKENADPIVLPTKSLNIEQVFMQLWRQATLEQKYTVTEILQSFIYASKYKELLKDIEY